MTGFIIVAVILVVVALGLIWWPMHRSAATVEIDRSALNVKIARERLAELKKELDARELTEAEFEQEKLALEKTLLDDVDGVATGQAASPRAGKWLVPVMVLCVPLIAGALYYRLGDPSALQPRQPVATVQTPAGEMPDIDTAISMLEQKLQQNPDNAEGWFMLGRTYMALQKYDKAVVALRKLRELAGDDPDVLVRLVDALAMQNGGQLSGEPAQLLETVLKKDPENIQGLWLMGMAEMEKGDANSALDYWQKLKPKLASDPASSQELQAMMEKAAEMTGKPLPVAAPETSTTASAATSAPSIKVNVSLDPALAAKTGPDETVFIYAKAINGPPMPLAIVPKKVSDLPLTVELNDSQAMMPAARLSLHDNVKVFARVSASGQAMAQVGDFIGEADDIPVKSGATADIVINREKTE